MNQKTIVCLTCNIHKHAKELRLTSECRSSRCLQLAHAVLSVEHKLGVNGVPLPGRNVQHTVLVELVCVLVQHSAPC